MERTKNLIRRLKLLGDARFWLWLSAGGFFLWAFLELSLNLFLDAQDAPKVIRLDGAILLFFLQLRRDWLNGPAVDVTALGSPTVLTGLVTATTAYFLLKGQRLAAWHLSIASLGAGALSTLLKRLLEKPRPSVIPHLVQVTGYSYPSGHTLMAATVYTTLAILAAKAQDRLRITFTLFGFAGMTILFVSLSRIYLGVHYPSDVAGGISLGLTWAFLIAALFAFLEKH